MKFWRRPAGSCLLAFFIVWGNAHARDISPESLLHSEASFRLAHLLDEPLREDESIIGPWPNAILELSEDIQHVLVADLKQHRLYLLAHEAGKLVLLREMYATIGKNGIGKQRQGDNRTPVGIYRITEYLDDKNLPELYGTGAFPVDYPNAWDRRLKRTGYGIWVHGVPRTAYSRQPLSSEGCVAIANEDLDSLKAFLVPGRSVAIFSDQLRWSEQRSELHAKFEEIFTAWLSAWRNLDTENYLKYYAADFKSGWRDREQFASQKRQVNSNKRFVQIEISKRSIYHYPAQENLIMVDFVQDYRSDNFSGISHKRQFWRYDETPEQLGQWLIVEESTEPLMESSLAVATSETSAER